MAASEGPYIADRIDGLWVVRLPNFVILASLPAREGLDQGAHARLMAAAPKLLHAAQRAVIVLRARGDTARPGNLLAALQDAIAAATGK